jgi:hypothetical protein
MPRVKSKSSPKKLKSYSSRSSPRRSPRTSPRRASPKQSSLHHKATDKQTKAVSELLSLLFHSRTQAHILHLQTDSYSAHKALNKYYDGIVDLVDKYAETYQGIYGIVKGYPVQNKYVEGQKEIIPYFKKLDKELHALQPKLPKDLDLENAFADILDLVHSTQYLLKELH